MTAFTHFLSKAHRHQHQLFTKPSQTHLSLLLHNHLYCRLLCSTPPHPPPDQPDPIPTPTPTPYPSPNPNPRTPIQVQPVSYAIKKTVEDNPPESPPQNPNIWPPPPSQAPIRPGLGPDNRPDTRAWTREDIRFVKDTPSYGPVSYPTRVAPLPEDRSLTEEGKEDQETEEKGVDERVRSKTDFASQRLITRVSRVEEEKVPFPTLIFKENSGKAKAVYDLKEAIQLVKAKAKCNFEETFEAHVKLTPDMRRTDLKLSGSVLLPHGSGKKYRVAVFAEGDAAVEAREAGATQVGGLEFIEEIKSGKKFDYDKCFATHQMMKHVLKIAKRLKRGMMPNPENGTVTNDMSRAIREAVSQTVLFQKDKTAIVHVPLGKVNYSDEALRDNIGAFMNALLLAKPAGLKKTSKYAGYVSTINVCSTMGPSFPVTVQSISMAVDRYNKVRLQV